MMHDPLNVKFSHKDIKNSLFFISLLYSFGVFGMMWKLHNISTY